MSRSSLSERTLISVQILQTHLQHNEQVIKQAVRCHPHVPVVTLLTNVASRSQCKIFPCQGVIDGDKLENIRQYDKAGQSSLDMGCHPLANVLSVKEDGRKTIEGFNVSSPKLLDQAAAGTAISARWATRSAKVGILQARRCGHGDSGRSPRQVWPRWPPGFGKYPRHVRPFAIGGRN